MTPLNQPGCTFDFQRYTPAVSKASKVHPGRFKGVHGRCPNGVRMYLYRASGRLDAVPAARRAPPGAATKVKTIFYLSVGRRREATAAAWGAPPEGPKGPSGAPQAAAGAFAPPADGQIEKSFLSFVARPPLSARAPRQKHKKGRRRIWKDMLG